MKNVLVLFPLFICFILGSYSQNADWINYTDSRTVNDIVIDGDFIWMTTDGGLIKYNNISGNTTLYQSSDGLPGTKVRKICLDNLNNKWMNIAGGAIAKYNGNQFNVYDTIISELQHLAITDLFCDNQNNIWMTISNPSLVMKLSNGTFTIYNSSNSNLPGGHYSAINEDNYGNVWIVCEGKLAKYQNTGDFEIMEMQGIGTSYCKGIDFDSSDNIWLLANGLSYYDGSYWSIYNSSNSGLPDVYYNDFEIDDSDNVWIATSGEGLVKFANNICTYYNTSNSNINSNECNSLKINNSYIIVGTNNGCSKFNEFSEWQYIVTQSSGLPTPHINGIAFDDNNKAWISTSNSGLVTFFNNEWEVFNTNNSIIPTNDINVVKSNQNDIWVGTEEGLLQITDTSWIVHEQFTDIYISSIVFDDSIVWVGTNSDGIAKILNNTVQFFNQNNSGISSNGVFSMSLGLNGRLWIVPHSQGIDMYNGSVWLNFNSNNSGLPDDFLKSITVSDDGTKWIGTYASGLVKFDDENWTIYNSINSFITSDFIGYLYFENNNLWISCYSAIVYNGNNHIIFNPINSGITSFDFSITTDSYGNYWFAGLGLAKYSGELNFNILIDHKKNNNFQLYPNPADDYLYFEFNNQTQSSYIVSIYSISGEKIITQTISTNSIQINKLQSGIYILYLTSKNKELIRTKFIKK